MKRQTSYVVVLLLIAVTLLTGCTGTAPGAAAAQEVAPATATSAPTAAPAPSATPEPSATPALTVAAAPAQGEEPAEQATPAWQPVVGATAADFELKDVDGVSHKLSDYIGQPLVLNFWATWCPHCQSEVPTFQQVYTERAGEGFILVAVSVGETADTVKQFVQENGMTFPVLLDSAGEAGGTYLVNGIPASFFIDRNGVIRGTHVGAITDAAALNNVIDQLME